MKYGHNPQRLFLWRVSNHIFPHQSEAQRARGKIWTSIAPVRKRHQGTNPLEDFRYQPVGCVWAILCYVFADAVEVDERFR